MSELTLEQKLAFLESEMAAIKEQIEQGNARKIDESYIGHVVEGRDGDDDEWNEFVLEDIDHSSECPYEFVFGAGWEQCRPRTKGPSVGYWIEHDGTRIPVDSQELVVIDHSDGESYSGRALGYDWQHVKRYAIIKVGE